MSPASISEALFLSSTGKVVAGNPHTKPQESYNQDSEAEIGCQEVTERSIFLTTRQLTEVSY